MAFSRPAPSSNNDSWKADAFINIHVPTKGGGSRKIGALPLHLSRNTDAKLIEFLDAGPENLEKLLMQLQLNYQRVKVDDPANELDL